MNILFKNALFALSWIPFLMEMPYVLNIWRNSRLERGSWILWVVALVSLAVCEFSRRRSSWDIYYKEHYSSFLAAAWFVVLMVLSLTACVFFRIEPHKVHAFYMLSAISLIISAVGWRFGLSVFVFQIPTYFFVLLGAPPIGYWIYIHLGYESRESYLITKLILGILMMFIWCIGDLLRLPSNWAIRRRHMMFARGAVALLWDRLKTLQPQGIEIPKPLRLLFTIIVAGLFIWALVSNKMSTDGQLLKLNFSQLQSTDWDEREDPVTEKDISFFKDCTCVERHTYFNDDSYVSVLALTGEDINDLHPMDVCLRSFEAEILSLEPVYLDINGAKMPLDEAKVRKDSAEFYSYAIYSNGVIFTGDFAKFRLLRRDSELWVHYQMVTPTQPDKEAVHARMVSFLEFFLKKHKTDLEGC